MSQKAIPILDFDALITAIQALSAPSATDVAVSTANMHYITEDDAQGALAELDAEAYAINSSLTQFNIHDILSTVRGTYSAIDSDGRIVIVELNKYIAVMSLQIKTTSAISSGSVTLSASDIPKARTKVHGALSTNDGKTGWVQYEDGVLFIRAQASTTSAYLCGQIVFPIKQS